MVVTGRPSDLAGFALVSNEQGLIQLFLPMRHPVHNSELLSAFLDETTKDLGWNKLSESVLLDDRVCPVIAPDTGLEV